MARARPEGQDFKQQTRADEREPEGEPFDGKEHVEVLRQGRPEEGLEDLGRLKTPPDPREIPVPDKAAARDARTKSRREAEHELLTARLLGGKAFAAIERNAEATRDGVLNLDAPIEGLAERRDAYRQAKAKLDEAVAHWAAEGRKLAEVKRYRVVDNNGGKGRLVSTGTAKTGSLGQAKLNPGKEIDSLNYDVELLKRQGVKLEEIRDDEAAA